MNLKDWTKMYEVVGAAMEVYNYLGRGLHEPIYQDALEIELGNRGIAYEREKLLTIYYKDVMLNKCYRTDYYFDGIVLELKSVEAMLPEHRAQLFNYLRLTKQDLGILINFGEKSLRSERYMYRPERDDFVLLTSENFKNYITKYDREGQKLG